MGTVLSVIPTGRKRNAMILFAVKGWSGWKQFDERNNNGPQNKFDTNAIPLIIGNDENIVGTEATVKPTVTDEMERGASTVDVEIPATTETAFPPCLVLMTDDVQGNSTTRARTSQS